MKVTREEDFKPITIVLETKEELLILKGILGNITNSAGKEITPLYDHRLCCTMYDSISEKTKELPV